MIALLEPCSEPDIWVTATAAPCTGIFKPVVPGKQLPENVGNPGESADHKSLWWRHELLHRQVMRDYPRISRLIQGPIDELQKSFIMEWEEHRHESMDQREALIKSMFDRADRLLDSLTEEVSVFTQSHGTKNFSSYWRRKNKEAGIVWQKHINQQTSI